MTKRITLIIASVLLLFTLTVPCLANGVVNQGSYTGYLPCIPIDSIRYRYRSNPEAYDKNVTYTMTDDRVLSTEDYTYTNYYAPINGQTGSSTNDLDIMTSMFDFDGYPGSVAHQSFEWVFIPDTLGSYYGLTTAEHQIYFGDILVADGNPTGNINLDFTMYRISEWGGSYEWQPLTSANTHCTVRVQYRYITRNNVSGLMTTTNVDDTFYYTGNTLTLNPISMVKDYVNSNIYYIDGLKVTISSNYAPDGITTYQLRSITLSDCTFLPEADIRSYEREAYQWLYNTTIIEAPDNWFGWIVNGINGFMQLEILPNVNLWSIFYGIMGFLLFIIIMKKFAGG